MMIIRIILAFIAIVLSGSEGSAFATPNARGRPTR